MLLMYNINIDLECLEISSLICALFCKLPLHFSPKVLHPLKLSDHSSTSRAISANQIRLPIDCGMAQSLW